VNVEGEAGARRRVGARCRCAFGGDIWLSMIGTAGEGYVGGGDWGRMGVRGNLQASRSVAAVGRGWGGGVRPRGGV